MDSTQRRIASAIALLVALSVGRRDSQAIVVHDSGALAGAEANGLLPVNESTGALQLHMADGSTRYGSGVLFNPKFVLSANHLGYDLGPVNSFTFMLGADIFTSPTHAVPVANVHYWPGSFGRTDWGNFVDLAIFELETSILDVAPAELYTGGLSVGEFVYMGGYGRRAPMRQGRKTLMG